MNVSESFPWEHLLHTGKCDFPLSINMESCYLGVEKVLATWARKAVAKRQYMRAQALCQHSQQQDQFLEEKSLRNQLRLSSQV